MQIDFNQQLKDINGDPLNEVVNGVEKPITLSFLAVEALLANSKGSTEISGEEKLERFQLAKKIKKSDTPVNVSSEQIAKLKKLIALCFQPLASGQAWEMLEASKTE